LFLNFFPVSDRWQWGIWHSVGVYSGSLTAALSVTDFYGGWIVPRVVFNLKRQNITAQHETNSPTQN